MQLKIQLLSPTSLLSSRPFLPSSLRFQLSYLLINESIASALSNWLINHASQFPLGRENFTTLITSLEEAPYNFGKMWKVRTMIRLKSERSTTFHCVRPWNLVIIVSGMVLKLKTNRCTWRISVHHDKREHEGVNQNGKRKWLSSSTQCTMILHRDNALSVITFLARQGILIAYIFSIPRSRKSSWKERNMKPQK